MNPDHEVELSVTDSGDVEQVTSLSLPVMPSSSFTEGSGVNPSSVGRRKRRGKNKREERREDIQREKEKKVRLYEEAINAYKNGEFRSYKKCAENFGVNNSVLRKYILTGGSYVGSGMVNQVLTPEEQNDIKNHILYMAEIGFGYTMYDLRKDIQDLLTEIVRYGVVWLFMNID